MAKILPGAFPEHLIGNRGFEAEKEVYDLLQQGLCESVTVLYRVRFLWQARNGINEQEADFIIVDKRQGALILEVKGGILTVEEGIWYQYNRMGRYRKRLRCNPFEQADRTRHNFIDYLAQNNFPWRKMSIGHAVVLPHCVKPQNIYGPDHPAELCVDMNDLKDVQRATDRVFKFWCGEATGEQTLEEEVDTEKLINLLGFNQIFQGFETMGPMVGNDNKILQEMSQHEAFIIDQLQNLPRVSVEGCAGSGKTSMAITEAVRRAEAGQRVGLFCYNRLLGESLQMATSGCSNPENIVAGAFLDLCLCYYQEAYNQEPAAQRGPEFWNSLPVLVKDCVQEMCEPFDAILIDEAQDFHETWWPAVIGLLKDREHGVLQIFHDVNQCIFGARPIPHIADMVPLVIHDNHRSPSGIGPVVQRYVADQIRFRRHTTPGRLKQSHPTFDGEPLQERLTELISNLIGQEKVDPGDVVILTPNTVEGSILKDNLQLGPYKLRRDYPSLQSPLPKDCIACYSVHRFKGLEAPVVIACEFIENHEELNRWQEEKYMQVCYTAFSRATTSLFILWED